MSFIVPGTEDIILTHKSVIYSTGCSLGNIRLRGGSTSMNGRVEVCLNGDWGTVCHDSWSTVDGNVACRQLGYSGSGMKGGKVIVFNVCGDTI